MTRLGLGWEDAREINPRLVYCSITGYGQDGPRAAVAGHDLNYCADTGFLSMTHGADGAPAIPQTQIADIGARQLPRRDEHHVPRCGRRGATAWGRISTSPCATICSPSCGRRVAMGRATGRWPQGNDMYPHRRVGPISALSHERRKYVACGALEPKFWGHISALLVGLEEELRDDGKDPEATLAGVAARIAAHDSAQLARCLRRLRGCLRRVVRSLDEALADPQFAGRGLFEHMLEGGTAPLPALSVPVAAALRGPPRAARAPALGGADSLLEELAPRGGGVKPVPRILLIQGANMAWLGKRQPELYGVETGRRTRCAPPGARRPARHRPRNFLHPCRGEAIARLYRRRRRGNRRPGHEPGGVHAHGLRAARRHRGLRRPALCRDSHHEYREAAASARFWRTRRSASSPVSVFTATNSRSRRWRRISRRPRRERPQGLSGHPRQSPPMCRAAPAPRATDGRSCWRLTRPLSAPARSPSKPSAAAPANFIITPTAARRRCARRSARPTGWTPPALSAAPDRTTC